MAVSWIALGGNQGSVAETFRRAQAALNEISGVSVVHTSRNYTTAPVGAVSGSPFLNAAAELQTSLTPHALLRALQSVEDQLGRVRSVHWGPRTLDLDLLIYEHTVSQDAELIVPHPHLWYRRFALDPLTEIAPAAVHPQHELTISQLRERLLVRPLPCQFAGGSVDERRNIRAAVAEFASQVVWLADTSEGGWLIFDLHAGQGALTPRFTTSPLTVHARRIPVRHFPTPSTEAVRDVLQAALTGARLADDSDSQLDPVGS